MNVAECNTTTDEYRKKACVSSKYGHYNVNIKVQVCEISIRKIEQLFLNEHKTLDVQTKAHMPVGSMP